MHAPGGAYSTYFTAYLTQPTNKLNNVMEEYDDGIRVVVADASHEKYVDTILKP